MAMVHTIVNRKRGFFRCSGFLQVLILVLMEHTLGVLHGTGLHTGVLILVLMEHTLGVLHGTGLHTGVLILVLMEHTLGEIMENLAENIVKS